MKNRTACSAPSVAAAQSGIPAQSTAVHTLPGGPRAEPCPLPSTATVSVAPTARSSSFSPSRRARSRAVQPCMSCRSTRAPAWTDPITR